MLTLRNFPYFHTETTQEKQNKREFTGKSELIIKKESVLIEA